jgi:hypothetical protein
MYTAPDGAAAAAPAVAPVTAAAAPAFTPAQVSDIAIAVREGADAIMLSGETGE